MDRRSADVWTRIPIFESFAGSRVNTPLVAVTNVGWRVYTPVFLGIRGNTLRCPRTKGTAVSEWVHSFVDFCLIPLSTTCSVEVPGHGGRKAKCYHRARTRRSSNFPPSKERRSPPPAACSWNKFHNTMDKFEVRQAFLSWRTLIYIDINGITTIHTTHWSLYSKMAAYMDHPKIKYSGFFLCLNWSWGRAGESSELILFKP